MLPPDQPSFRLLAGPPAGPALWRSIAPRLVASGASVDTPDLLDPDAATFDAAVDALVRRPAHADTWLVAHGLAVPVAVAAASARAPRGLVLLNGPLRTLDPVTRAVATLARARVLRPLLTPRVWLPLLASSAALRRTVNNPYAMDRDTVATICGPLVADRDHRRALATFLSSIPSALPDPRLLTCPVSLLWGDEDVLHPLREADWLDAALGGGRTRTLPGGRFFFPEEQPWAVADALLAVAGRGA